VLIEDLSKKLTPTDANVRKEYERVKAEHGGEMGKQYKARHILVKEEADAKQIIVDLDAGGDFAAIAKEKSEDTGTKEQGGELDWSEAEGYVQPFGEALEARQHLAELAAAAKDSTAQFRWLNEIIQADRTAGSTRTERSKYLAAEATLVTVQPAVMTTHSAVVTGPLLERVRTRAITRWMAWTQTTLGLVSHLL